MKRIEKGEIRDIRVIAENLAWIKISLPLTAGDARPGNFVTLLPPSDSGRYLRRPFSISGVSEGCIELVIKGIGPVTSSLARMKPGDVIESLGPLGNCYEALPSPLWMIGGGTGIASLLFLNSARNTSGIRGDRLLWAGKSSPQLPSESMIAGCGHSCLSVSGITFATDDGSAGEEGTAHQVLEKWLSSSAEGRPAAIAACGPHAMMKAVKQVADRAGIPAWFSLEEFMACGSGACAGCAVPASAGGYLKACDDGPVFRGSDILL